MSFTVKLYTVDKFQNSTKQPEGSGAEYLCAANTPFSIAYPTLQINAGDGLVIYNYAYIPSVGRYYFIREWTFERGLWVADCAVDVLASWKRNIGDSSLYVMRSASDFNGAVLDSSYPPTAEIVVNEKALTLTDADGLPWRYDGVTGSYVLGIIGAGGAVGYWYFTEQNYKTLMSKVFDPAIYDLQAEQEKRDFNPLQYIVSALWFPFTMSSTGILSKLKLGWWDVVVPCDFVGSTLSAIFNTGKVTIPRHPQNERGDYLDTDTYSSYSLQLPCFGAMALPNELLRGAATLEVTMEIELSTGTALLKVNTNTRSKPIVIQETQVGCPVQIAQVTNSFIGNLSNAAISGAKALFGEHSFSGQFLSVARTSINALGDVVPYIKTNDAAVSVAGSMGSRTMTTISPAFISSFTKVVDEDKDHHGRPLCKLRKISTLSGYVQVMDGDILAPATLGELTQIKTFLEGGFFYE